MKIPIISLFLVFIGSQIYSDNYDDEKELLFSVSIIKSAFGGDSEGKNGYYYYLHGNSVTGERYRNGEFEGLWGGGSYTSTRILKKLEEIEFESFDFEAELEKAKEIAHTVGKEPIWLTFDGAKYRIEFSYKGESMVIEKWNPKTDLDIYPKYSEKLMKLREVVELFALEYGRSKFGI